MAELEVIATQTSTALRTTLGRLAMLAKGLAIGALLVGAATYATLLWVTDGAAEWILLGLVICLAPFAAAAVAWWRVSRTRAVGPKALDDLHTVLRDRQARQRFAPLIDHDTQQPLGSSARDFRAVRQELNQRRKELPALFSTVRAMVTVPALVAVAILGTLLLGLAGTILLIVGLVT